MSEPLTRTIEFICGELAAITGRPLTSFSEQSELIGSSAVVASRGFVELLLAVEDFASEQLGFAFDWTGDSAMSEARSHFRTVGTLASYLITLSAGESGN